MATSLAAMTARRAATFTRFPISSSTTQSASISQRRGLAGAADHHGPPKVNCWKEPMNPAQWKEEHFVIVSLSGWGLLFYGGYKLFTGGKKNKEEVYEVVLLTECCWNRPKYSSVINWDRKWRLH